MTVSGRELNHHYRAPDFYRSRPWRFFLRLTGARPETSCRLSASSGRSAMWPWCGINPERKMSEGPIWKKSPHFFQNGAVSRSVQGFLQKAVPILIPLLFCDSRLPLIFLSAFTQKSCPKGKTGLIFGNQRRKASLSRSADPSLHGKKGELSCCILVVEDEVALRQDLKSRLAESGFGVDLAARWRRRAVCRTQLSYRCGRRRCRAADTLRPGHHSQLAAAGRVFPVVVLTARKPVELTTCGVSPPSVSHDERGNVMSATVLAGHIYDESTDHESNVMQHFVYRLRRKLDPEDRIKPIGNGLTAAAIDLQCRAGARNSASLR